MPPAGPPLWFAFLRRGGLGWAVTCPDLCPCLSVSIGNHLQGRCFGEAKQDGPCMRTGALVCPPHALWDGWCWAMGSVLSTSSCRDITGGDALWGGATTQELPSCQASHPGHRGSAAEPWMGQDRAGPPQQLLLLGKGSMLGSGFSSGLCTLVPSAPKVTPAAPVGTTVWLVRFLTDSCFLIF